MFKIGDTVVISEKSNNYCLAPGYKFTIAGSGVHRGRQVVRLDFNPLAPSVSWDYVENVILIVAAPLITPTPSAPPIFHTGVPECRCSFHNCGHDLGCAYVDAKRAG